MFEPDFSAAKLDEATFVTFTHAESQLLSYLSRHPRQTLSRDQILDALTEAGSDRRDRTIDFLINRIRRKLKDNPKDPKFIATRYGGGYVWVAKPESVRQEPADDAHVFIGPMRGLDAASSDFAPGAVFAESLALAFKDVLEPDLKVALDIDAGSNRTPPPAAAIQVELSFFRDSDGLECVVTSRAGEGTHVVLAERVRLSNTRSAHAVADSQCRELASRILNESWRTKVDANTFDSPLPIAMQNASIEQFDSRKTLEEIGPKLKAMRAQHADDPHFKLIYATYLHSEYVVRGFEPGLIDPARRQSDLAEIEQLVLGALDYAQSRPHLGVMAAKLLYFVDRSYKPLALELASNAHRSNTAIAPSLAIVGQFHGFLGNTDTAVDYLKQADALSDPNSTFDRYVLIILCQVLIAAGRRDELPEYRTRIYGQHPLLRIFLEPLFTDPDHPSMRAKGAMFVMSRARTTALLSNLHFVWTRLCEDPAHQSNALRAPVSLAVRRHGRSVVPDEIIRDIPGLFI
ncbi:MAG: helix-turn-helix domain-containing protein [Boseongicola sp.]|nr:helix-turn-helix domain-containing protein [Boseongicola sp.]